MTTPNNTPSPLLSSARLPHDLRSMTIPQLQQVAQEIRDAIVEQVRQTGGHLAPNLGVVELTIALHVVFDFAYDRLLFDVGHQCYPHKLLTGRAHQLSGLRTRTGIAGFPEPRESSYDLFSVGHAGTGISTAVGMARGDSLTREGYHPTQNPTGRRVVSLIGDASIANGVAMEGLNNAGTLGRQFLVILNDNGMSISKPQGGLSQYFDRLRVSHLYSDVKRGAKRRLEHFPGGDRIRGAIHAAGEATKAIYHQDAWFEHMGLKTIGPIDGHDLPTLIEYLREARDFDRPLVLHVKTVKGKGYKFAETDSTRFHSPNAFNKVEGELDEEGCRVELKSDGRSFTTAAGDALTALMEKDPRVVACTAAMPDGTGVSKALARFPERAWDVGICESHAMDMMAGLAKTGFKPFFAVYCTFVQRAFDQAFQEVALQGLPVRLLLDRAGLVGGDGAVHHGFCDVSLLRVLPDAIIMAAIDEPSLVAAMEFMRGPACDRGLSTVRYPRDVVSTRFTSAPCPPFVTGKARHLQGPAADAPTDLAVLAFGTPAITACEAADAIHTNDALHVTVYDARFAKPIDRDLVRSFLSRGVPIVTIEDHSIVGGFGSAVVEAAQEMGLDASLITRLGLPDRWVYQDSRSRQLAEVGLDVAGLSRAFRDAIKSAADRSPADFSRAK
ncbi:MAG TPA: 1-deoxy-D-xylulose-5-phosphate synthase [Phycisphaerales bacterium]|nr:1-deoxy-D-xylulose-5-phosphate synthase [Phycisphaerales bacterium]